MTNRHKKIVLEAEEGITFKVSNRNGVLVIRALNSVESEVYQNLPDVQAGEYAEELSVYTDKDGNQAVVPPGWIVSKVEKFSEDEFSEPLESELLEQVESVKRYGGFYISRYNISKSMEEKTQSVKGAMPWVYINNPDAIRVASTIEDNATTKSHLTYGAEYDSMLEWLIESGCKAVADIAEDSTNWGNYVNAPHKVVETGSSEEWEANNICDLAGNVDEWTQERYDSDQSVIRGGHCGVNGDECPVACRISLYSSEYYDNTGFRAALYIK